MGADVRIIAGPPLEEGLWAYAEGATDCWAASEWETWTLHADRNALIREVDTRELAAEVKLKLMDCYPEESPIYVRAGEGSVDKDVAGGAGQACRLRPPPQRARARAAGTDEAGALRL